MPEFNSTKKLVLSNEIKLIAGVCAQDDIISAIELESSFSLINKVSQVSQKEFDLAIEEFFQDSETLEQYFFNCVTESISTHELLDMCRIAATSDGFSIKENYAFIKLCRLAGEDHKTFYEDDL